MNEVRTSLAFAKELAKHGYHVYSDIQYKYDIYTKEYKECHYTLEQCAYYELCMNDTFVYVPIVYVPTIEHAYRWIIKKDPNWNIAILWNSNMKGYYFIVQNIETGYEYIQPAIPNETNREMLYEWAMEHILNRMNTNE